tara:strand:+ start:5236 stop:5532 length:297 start_codon:yes stop_codon:yes gene_type:complete
MARSRMKNQMSEQMGISKREASNLMKKASVMNDMNMKKGGSALKEVDESKNPGLAKLPTEVRNKMGYMADGGMARIQGTPPAQVKGFTYNDNDGKGTF